MVGNMRWSERLRSILLRTGLWIYNACAFVALMVMGWRNALWNEKKWTPIGPGPGTGDRGPGKQKS